MAYIAILVPRSPRPMGSGERFDIQNLPTHELKFPNQPGTDYAFFAWLSQAFILL